MYTKEDRMRDYMEGAEIFEDNKKFLDICVTRARYISENYLRTPYNKIVAVKLYDII